jgi:hypothetical protein
MLYFCVFACTEPRSKIPTLSERVASHLRPPGSASSPFKIFPSQAATFAPILRPHKSFSCNTYETPCKCCKQKTYDMAKTFRCNTYKKQGGASFKPKADLPSSGPSSVPYLFISFHLYFLFPPSRDEKPVTATPLLPTLTNRDAHNGVRIRSYENFRVTSLKPNIFHFPSPAVLFPLFSFRPCELCALCVNSDSFFQPSTVNLFARPFHLPPAAGVLEFH